MTDATQDPLIPLQLPASHLRVIMAALGKLPLEVAGPTDTFIKSQIAQLAIAAKKQQAEQEAQKKLAQTVGDVPPDLPDTKKSPATTAKKKAPK